MRLNFYRLDPRGWAAIVVLGGTAIAVAFLRVQNDPNDSRVSDSTSANSFFSSPLSSHSDRSSGVGPALVSPSSRAVDYKLPPQGSVKSPAATETLQPVMNEFPEWARKPSPLDALMKTKAHGSQGVAVLPETRKPKSLTTWAQNADDSTDTAETRATVDRYTPFSEEGGSSYPSFQELANFQWPDHSPNVEEIAKPKRPATEFVGARTDLDRQHSASDRSSVGFSEMPSLVNTPDKSPNVMSERNSDFRPENGGIGASLRSHRIPHRELFIHQPGLQ